MIKYFIWKLLQFLGYRKVLYLPSNRGLHMADFYKWKFCPDIAKGNYTEYNFPFYMLRT